MTFRAFTRLFCEKKFTTNFSTSFCCIQHLVALFYNINPHQIIVKANSTKSGLTFLEPEWDSGWETEKISVTNRKCANTLSILAPTKQNIHFLIKTFPLLDLINHRRANLCTLQQGSQLFLIQYFKIAILYCRTNSKQVGNTYTILRNLSK